MTINHLYQKCKIFYPVYWDLICSFSLLRRLRYIIFTLGSLTSVHTKFKDHAKRGSLEIKELKKAIAILIGTGDLPSDEQFSKAALDKVSVQFQKISIERGEWISYYDLNKYFKNAHRAGAFIIREFKFTNYFKRGRTYYFNKKSITALAKELKDRNIDLTRYIE